MRRYRGDHSRGDCTESYYWSDMRDGGTDGNLEALKLLRTKGASWVEETCSAAAAGGHLKVLKWARKKGCQWGTWACP